MKAPKCLICRTTEYDSSMEYIDQIICETCYSITEQTVYTMAVEHYPKIVEKIAVEMGQKYYKSFEQYCSDNMNKIFHNHYYRKVMMKQYSDKRSDILKYLPKTLTKKELNELKTKAICELTGLKSDITMEHFIPLSWGHGGEYIGNIYFMNRELNSSKSNKNPFKWIQEMSHLKTIKMSKWDELIEKLALENNLSVKEFVKYVNWCGRNQRTLEQLKNDNTASLELWRMRKK